jgi:hypothetical protein
MISSVLALLVYFIFFAIIHSVLADPHFKETARRSLGKSLERWYHLAFVLLALYMVLPFLYILIVIPGKVLYIVPFPWSWLMTSSRILALIALLLALKQTGFSQFFGVAQLHEIDKAKTSHLVTTGFYCRLRNLLCFLVRFFSGSRLP